MASIIKKDLSDCNRLYVKCINNDMSLRERVIIMMFFKEMKYDINDFEFISGIINKTLLRMRIKE